MSAARAPEGRQRFSRRRRRAGPDACLGAASAGRRARKFFWAKFARNPLISPEFAEIFCNFWKRIEIFGSLFGRKLKLLAGK